MVTLTDLPGKEVVESWYVEAPMLPLELGELT